MNGSLKAKLLANYIGQGWRAVIGLIFIPLYIKYLGIEAYGLIAIFALLQGWFGLLEMGMMPALGREMARFTGGGHSAQSIRDLLRTIEIIGLGLGVMVFLAIWSASGWLASHWLRPENLPTDVATQAFVIIGAITGLRFLENLYVSSIVGLQRQVLQNVLASTIATVRAVGAVGVLIWVSPTIKAFFIWQGLVSIAGVAILAAGVYTSLPKSDRFARFSVPSLRSIWGFSAGMMAIAILSLLLTQVDKLLLSRLLTLESFAHYALAGVMSNALYMLVIPIATVFYPRFTELMTRGDETALRTAYHEAAQLVTVLLGASALVLSLHSSEILRLWTSNPELEAQVAPILSVVAIGTLINGLLVIPYHLQLAQGWTSLEIKFDIFAVCLLVPAVLWAAPIYGAVGGAWAWVVLNATGLVVVIPLMHKFLLTTEKWRWYGRDVAVPLAGIVAVVLLCRALAPNDLGKLGTFSVLSLTLVSALGVGAFLAPAVRHHIGVVVQRGISSLVMMRAKLL